MRSITRRDSTSSSSSSSSTDSSSNYHTHTSLSLSSLHNYPHDLGNKMKSSLHLPTHLTLGLSLISTTTPNFSPRQQDWPPIKTGMRRALITGTADGESSITIPKSPSSSKQQRNMLSSDNSLFVKVIMEGIKIGRKIDILAIHGYPHLVTTLEHMFTTPNILWAGDDQRWNSHVLTYEDQDGDWMMVGDVPWEMFLTTVKRIKITRTFNSSSS